MHNSFTPEDIALLQPLIDDACAKSICDEAQKDMIAIQVLSFASTGPRDYKTLLAVATLQRPTTLVPTRNLGARAKLSKRH
jgi:hypothetical protein